MKPRFLIRAGLMALVLAFGLSSCKRQNNVCPELTGTPQAKHALADLLALPPPEAPASPRSIEIGGKMILVDRLIEGPLCNDTWQGTIYVGCEAVVAAWDGDEENPLFLKGCSLAIEPGTVVYVAAHNDAAYYKGCSCHTGEDPLP